MSLWCNRLIEEAQRLGLRCLPRGPRTLRGGGPITFSMTRTQVLAAIVVAVVEIPKLVWPNGFAAPRTSSTAGGDKGCEALTQLSMRLAITSVERLARHRSSSLHCGPRSERQFNVLTAAQGCVNVTL